MAAARAAAQVPPVAHVESAPKVKPCNYRRPRSLQSALGHNPKLSLLYSYVSGCAVFGVMATEGQIYGNDSQYFAEIVEMPISLVDVRRRILIALFSDDELMDELVLKGGNALALVYKVGSRASLDMDFSIKKAFDDVDRAGKRILATLRAEFGRAGYVLFDEKFAVKPSNPLADQPGWWGGYQVAFKLAAQLTYDKFAGDLEGLRRNSEVLGPAQKRIYTIDISQHEFCEGKVQREVDDYIIYVYSLEMIAAEKLRALCQQMPEYKHNRTHSPRARDFYDIHQIIAGNGIDLMTPANTTLISAVFAAKEVPVSFLARIGEFRDFHAPDWPAVSDAIAGKNEGYNFYFDYVADLATKLHSFGIVETPRL